MVLRFDHDGYALSIESTGIRVKVVMMIAVQLKHRFTLYVDNPVTASVVF